MPVSTLREPDTALAPLPMLRQRAPRDAPSLMALFNQASVLRSALLRDPFSSAEEVNLWLQGIPAPRRIELVATQADICAGYGAVFAFGEHFDHCGSLMLAVSDAFRGQNIGGRLLDALGRIAAQTLGLRKLQLTVLTENCEAIGFYMKRGFEFEGRHRRFARRGDGFADAYAMALMLEPGASMSLASVNDKQTK